ncbi:ATP-dependent DNA ligase [Candidatus Microgenomates bacterium]|nr:ATP-dependent DNA ligase [Candidatus Microgenomates bacterium]
MTFAQFSSYLEKLEKTSSRLILIDILADLFRHASKDEIEKIIYLSQGRIAPFFEATEIGMAEKTVAESIAKAFNSTKEAVLKLYGKLGDMGIVASLLNSKVKNPAFAEASAGGQNSKLAVDDVFETLTKIAKTQGEGTVEKRQQLLSDLLKKLDSVSVKHLVRIPLGNMRLGIGDPTILDGLAKAKLGDKSKRKLLEGAYNKTSDMGLIAKTLFSGGIAAVNKLKVQVGKPIRSELCERLPTAEKVIEKMSSVDVQYKYDGFRVQIHKDGERVSMFSRNLENMTHMFPELIKATLQQVKAKTAILDTEALAYQVESEEFLPFQETTKRRRKYGIAEMAQKLPLKAFAFDILYKDGRSLIDLPLRERIAILQKTISEDGVLMVSQTEQVRDVKRLTILLEDAISKGLEGLVVKRLQSPYEAGGRNFNWVKLKRHSSGELQDTIDCVILGYIFGRGKRTAFGAGALLVGVYDESQDEFVTVSKIGTGLTDEEWREIKVKSEKLKVKTKPARVNSKIVPSVWVEPKIVIEVLADEITKSPLHTAGLALRFPRLVSFRGLDKRAEDATTVKELVEMYKEQFKK